MSHFLQRMRERYDAWRDEKRGSAADWPSGNDRLHPSNPLRWAVLGAIILLLPPYPHRDIFDLMLPGSAVVFLVFYFVKSRFAWHVLALEILVGIPLYTFFSYSWRLQRTLHPGITWVPAIGTILIATFLFCSRKNYFRYLAQQKTKRD